MENSAQDLIKSFLQIDEPSNSFDFLDSEVQISSNSSSFLQTDEIGSVVSASLSLPDSFEQLISSNTNVFKEQISFGRPPCSRCDLTKRYYQAILVDIKSAESDILQRLKLSEQKLSSAVSELAQVKQLASRNEDKLKLEISILEEKANKLTTLLEESNRERTKVEGILRTCQKSTEEAESLREKAESLEFIVSNQKKIVELAREAEDKLQAECEHLKIRSDVLEKDKRYLENENEKLGFRLQQQIVEFEKARSKSLEQEVKMTQLTDQIMQLKIQHGHEYENKLDRELQRVRDESLKELDVLRSTARDISDREARVLREAKLSAEAESAALGRRCEQLQEEISKLQKQLISLESDKVNEISELKSELKLRSFEVTNLTMKYEENAKQLKLYEIDLEKSEKELALHKVALLRMEADFAAERQKLMISLDESRTRLTAYEALEVQIDSTVMRVAKANNDSAVTITEEPVLGLPTSPERRIRQAVFLAQKLLRVEQEKNDVIVELGKLKEELNELKNQKETMERFMTRAAQPTSYLVSKLEEIEKVLAHSRKESNSLTNQLDYWKSQCQLKEKEVLELHQRLENLLKQREELEAVRSMIEHLHDGSDDSESDEEREGEVEINMQNAINDSTDSIEGTAVEKTKSGLARAQVESEEERIQRLSSSLGIPVEMVKSMLIPPSHGTKSILINQEKTFKLLPSTIGIKQVSYERKILSKE